MWTHDLLNQFGSQGFAIIPDVATSDETARLASTIDQSILSNDATARRERNGVTFGVRNLLSIKEVASFAASVSVRRLIEPVLGPDAIPVRGIFFDKTADANWKVPWHQDLSITVREKREAPGFGPWSVKAGVIHVQPPLSILQSMLTIRLHLDDCGADNGPLLTLPGSHAAGVLDLDSIRAWRESKHAVTCTTAAGGAVLMRPLLLHASSVAAAPRRRRVVHIEFASEPLPNGLRWQEE